MFIAIVLTSLLSFGSPQTSPAQRIVAASNVRLRSAPQTAANEVVRLALGTVVTELEASEDSMWVRVQLPEGKAGWIFTGLTQSYNERDAITIQRELIESRLAVENLSFSDGTELLEFVTRVSPSSGPATAQFDLFKLLALERSVRSISGEDPKDPTHRAWVKGHEDKLAYSEPAGQWMVRAELYWNLEAKHRGNAIADQIAWEGARAGVPSECEGYIPCTFAVIEMTDGRYLELYPSGTHVAEAIEHIDYPLREIARPDTHYTMDPRDNAQLHESIVKLSAIVERTSGPIKAEVLARLKRIDQTYVETTKK